MFLYWSFYTKPSEYMTCRKIFFFSHKKCTQPTLSDDASSYVPSSDVISGMMCPLGDASLTDCPDPGPHTVEAVDNHSQQLLAETHGRLASLN